MFKYRKLDLQGSEFRLVRLQKGEGILIECELIHTTLDGNVIPYEAVSYTWGTLKKERQIYVTGKILPVTSNLWQVLHDLRSPDADRYLWVDGVCINQTDNLERGHQVQQMKYIYQSADRGIFYLSPHTAIAKVIMESLKLLQKQVAGSRWAPNDERWNAAWQKVQIGLRNQYDDLETRQREGLAYLLLSPFFRRVWILQEVASVCRASVFCGKYSISAHIFAIGARIENPITNAHTLAVIDLMQRHLDNTTNLLQGKNLAFLLKQFSESEASDERDRIYALLGLCHDAEALAPNYAHPESRVVERTLDHIYGKNISFSLSYITTVQMLVDQLKKPPSDFIADLERRGHPEALFDFINGVEAPLDVSDRLALRLVKRLVQSHQSPIKVLHKVFAWSGKRLDVIPYHVVAGRRWSAEVLELLYQHGLKIIVHVGAAFVSKIPHAKIRKLLIEPEVIIGVSMKGLWIMLLLSDDDTKALIPLLNGNDSRSKTIAAHLRAVVSQFAGSFCNRDAVMLLCRLTGDTNFGHDNNATPIRGSCHLGSRRRMSLNSIQMTREYEGTAELTSPSSRYYLLGRPTNIDSQFDLPPVEKWRPGMNNFDCHSQLRGIRGRSQSI